jgi:N5-(cytidine 5'-diphosphoramidyl)-L-glutamine hydrolase
MIHKRKRIGISLRVEHFKKNNEKRDTISQDWMMFLKKVNVFPILIPNTILNIKLFFQEMGIDGFILSGGDNIGDDPERDQTEKEIIEYSIDHKIPILGICRGMQVINRYFEGSIITTVNMNHVRKNHDIQIINKNISKEFGTNLFEVNSFHNNIIKKENLGKNLEVFAISKNDETVEGFFHKEFPMVGVMWHPEREIDFKSGLNLINILEKNCMWNSN